MVLDFLIVKDYGDTDNEVEVPKKTIEARRKTLGDFLKGLWSDVFAIYFAVYIASFLAWQFW